MSCQCQIDVVFGRCHYQIGLKLEKKVQKNLDFHVCFAKNQSKFSNSNQKIEKKISNPKKIDRDAIGTRMVATTERT